MHAASLQQTHATEYPCQDYFKQPKLEMATNSQQRRLLIGVRQQRLATAHLGAIFGDVAALAGVETPPSVAALLTLLKKEFLIQHISPGDY